MKFSCENCGQDCDLEKIYINGKGLEKNKFKTIEIKCEACGSKHTLVMKYVQKEKNNTLAYIVDFEKIIHLNISNAFIFEETNDIEAIIGHMSKWYLVMGFDAEKELKKKINSIKNKTDNAILNHCYNIVKISRNKILQHNKNKETLSSLTEIEIFPIFFHAINTIVILLKKNGHIPYDMEDRRMQEKKIIFK